MEKVINLPSLFPPILCSAFRCLPWRGLLLAADTHVPLEGWTCSPIPKFTGGLDIICETWGGFSHSPNKTLVPKEKK